MTRPYARSLRGSRALASAPRNWGDNVSIIGALGLVGPPGELLPARTRQRRVVPASTCARRSAPSSGRARCGHGQPERPQGQGGTPADRGRRRTASGRFTARLDHRHALRARPRGQSAQTAKQRRGVESHGAAGFDASVILFHRLGARGFLLCQRGFVAKEPFDILAERRVAAFESQQVIAALGDDLRGDSLVSSTATWPSTKPSPAAAKALATTGRIHHRAHRSCGAAFCRR